MKRIKRGSFKATFIDRRGSRRQDISLSLNRTKSEEAINSLSSGAPVEPSSRASLTANECTVAVSDLDGPDDFQRHSVTAHENRRIQEQLKWEKLRDILVPSKDSLRLVSDICCCSEMQISRPQKSVMFGVRDIT